MNLSNDVFDAETGVDENKVHSLVNLTGNKPLIFWLGNLFFRFGMLGSDRLVATRPNRDWVDTPLLCAGLQLPGTSFRFGYQGLGDYLLCTLVPSE